MFSLSVQTMMPLKICPYLPKPLDGLDVRFVLLHLLPESNGLLRLCWVDVLGPATLAMVHTSILCFITHCVHLVCVCVVCMHIHMVEVEKSYSVSYKGNTNYCSMVHTVFRGRGDTNLL